MTRSSLRWLRILGFAALVVTAVPARAAGTARPPVPRDREEIAAQQTAVDRHLLRVQRERFEADARGDDPRRLRRLGREFRRTQLRRRDLAHAAEQAASSR